MEELDRIAAGAIDFLHAATPIEPGRIARYPGEGTLRIREESMRLGVAVDEAAWNALLAGVGEVRKPGRLRLTP